MIMEKELIKKLTMLAIVIILSTAALSISIEAIVTWHSELADTGRRYSEGLGYDALGRPGIAQMGYYDNPYLAVYRYRSTSGWVSETIGEARNAPELAFNNSKQAAVIYVDYTGTAYNLIYARRTSENTWVKSTIESVPRTQGYIESVYSLSFNSSGNPSVSYVKTINSPYSCTLYYAAFNGSTWQKQAVYTKNDTFYSDLTFNGSTPSIAFSAGKEGLKYAYLSSGKWIIQTVDASSSTYLRNRHNHITLRFGNGKPLISYNDQETRSLKFAYLSDTGWVKNIVEASSSEKNYTGNYASMQVSQGTSGYVVYLVHSNYVLNGTTSIRLKTLAVNNLNDLSNLSFASQTIYTGRFGNISPFLVSGLKDGNPSIAFLDFLGGKTTYISMQPRLQAVSSISFDPFESGTSQSRNITITNNGSINLLLSEIVAPSAPFRITSGDTGSLAPGQSRVINVYFEPTSAGQSYSGVLSLKSNDPNHPVFNISLTGRSVGDNANLTALRFSNGQNMVLAPGDNSGELTVEYATETLKITPTAADSYAQIRVEGEVVQTGASSQFLPLVIGLNTVEIVVTSEDTKTVKTYTLNITRKDSPDASLSGFTISEGALSPAFSPEILDYSMILPDGVDSFSFTPTATQEGSIIRINGTSTTSGAMTLTQTPEVGSNTYDFHVLAPDGDSSKIYYVNVLKLPEISGISLEHGVLSPEFDPYNLTYTATVPNSIVTTKITLTTLGNNTHKVNGETYSSVLGYAQVNLVTGENIINIEVVSGDSETSRTYTLIINRLPGLIGLSVGDAYVMIFENQFELSTYITQPESPIIFSAPDGMSVDIIGINASADGISETISFQEGLNGPYTIELTSPESVEKTIYHLNVYRYPMITSLKIAGDTIETWSDEYLHVHSVANTMSSTAISVTVNTGTTVETEGNYAFSPVDGVTNTWTVTNLRIGSNPMYLRLTSSDHEITFTYPIIIYRLPGLSNLSISPGALNLDFSVDTYNYSANVDKDVNSIELTAVVSTDEYDTYCILSINSAVAYSDSPSEPIELSYGSNIIPIVVSSEDTSITYSVNVIREGPMSPTLSVTELGFDKNPETRADVMTDITWNDANSVTDIKVGEITVGTENYILTDINGATSTLTIKKDFLDIQEIGELLLTIEFNEGNAASLSISISDSTAPAFIPVTSIFGVPVEATVSMPLNLTSMISPNEASNSEITWSIQDAGTTGATVSGDVVHTISSGIVIVRATIINGLGLNSNYIQDFEITVKDAPVTTYTVTFKSNDSTYATRTVTTADTVGSTNWPSNPLRSGYNFIGWYASDDGTGTMVLSTTVISSDMILYAKWMANSPNTVSIPTSPIYSADVSGGGTVPVSVNTSTGIVSLDLGSYTENLSEGVNTVFSIPHLDGINRYTANLPSLSLSVSAGGSLTMSTHLGNITIPDNMLTDSGLSGNASISISEGIKSNLSEDVKFAIGDRPLISLTLSIDGALTDWSNHDASVTISIPYSPTEDELKNPESIVIWYIDGSGGVTCVTNGFYDAANGTVTFSTNHFSDFAVVFSPVKFDDVAEDAWYNKSVNFIASREIALGTGNGNFNPNAKLTRGDFIVLSMRAYNIAADEYSTNNFSDAGSTYYSGYLAATKRLGLSNGVGNDQFAPMREITRQEMFTLLYNILKSIKQLPQVNSFLTISDFSDTELIESWAEEAITFLVEAGIVEGNTGKLNPTGTTTRAEMAQVLYRLILNNNNPIQ